MVFSVFCVGNGNVGIMENILFKGDEKCRRDKKRIIFFFFFVKYCVLIFIIVFIDVFLNKEVESFFFISFMYFCCLLVWVDYICS